MVATLNFDQFCLRHPGQTAYVIGRGPTTYDYDHLCDVAGPVFFINDAVSLENKLREQQESYFFALDRSMRVWLDRIRSVAVLPTNHVDEMGRPMILDGDDDPILSSMKHIILWKIKHSLYGSVCYGDRARIAKMAWLCTGSGTIHPLLHFVWYTGCTQVVFIGCDGINDPSKHAAVVDSTTGYDRRLPNVSKTHPWWVYNLIRNQQDQMCRDLGLKVKYLGTPVTRNVLKKRHRRASSSYHKPKGVAL